MGNEPCGNEHSVTEIDVAVHQQTQRIVAALDAMAISDVKQLVDEIESKISDD